MTPFGGVTELTLDEDADGTRTMRRRMRAH
jgi:hypothetical protein